jgi:type I restriction enzyme S subunit
MTLDTFFEKFELLADAPDAVGRMRELILRLAVRGALTTKQETDEPVGKLVKELDHCCGKRSGKSRQGRALGSERSSGERPFSIPDHWTWIHLNRIGSLSGGLTPSKSNPAYWDGDLNWFTSRDIKSDELMESGLKITTLAAAENGLQRYRPGCLFMVARSGILRRTFPVSINRVEATSNQDIKVLEPYIEGLERYIQIMLRGMTGFILSSLVKTGTTVESLKYLEFENQQFPLPPLAEQKRIVAKVEELMALCDRLEAQQQERATRHAALARASLARFAEAPTPANLHLLFHPSYDIPPAELRKAILTLAVQGKLVEQDPGDEEGGTLVTRAAAEPSAGDEHDLVGKPLTRSEIPFDLPRSWAWTRLGTVASIKHGFAFPGEGFTEDRTDFVVTTPGSFHERGGFRDRGPKTKYYRGDVPKGFIFEAGDLIIPMTEQAPGLLGSPAFVPDDGRFHLHNQRIGKLTFKPCSVLPEFAFWFFNTPFFRGELARTCTGMKVRHTSPRRVLAVPIPVCSQSEQRRIVAKVEQLMALVDRLEARLATSRESAGKLLEAVVSKLTGPAAGNTGPQAGSARESSLA